MRLVLPLSDSQCSNYGLLFLLQPGLALQLMLRVHGDRHSYAAVSRCLLSYGADVLKLNGKGETPLQRCQGSEVELLIRETAACGGY